MEAITEFERLVKHRSDPSFWEDNIIQAHSLCKNEQDHKLFYLFLCSPRGQFNPEQIKHVKTLGDMMHDPQFKPGIEELPPELTQDVYQNGNEIIIRTRRKDTPALPAPKVEEDDEKAEPVPIEKMKQLAV